MDRFRLMVRLGVCGVALAALGGLARLDAGEEVVVPGKSDPLSKGYDIRRIVVYPMELRMPEADALLTQGLESVLLEPLPVPSVGGNFMEIPGEALGLRPLARLALALPELLGMTVDLREFTSVRAGFRAEVLDDRWRRLMKLRASVLGFDYPLFRPREDPEIVREPDLSLVLAVEFPKDAGLAWFGWVGVPEALDIRRPRPFLAAGEPLPLGEWPAWLEQGGKGR
jgi:hypothetical protein